MRRITGIAEITPSLEPNPGAVQAASRYSNVYSSDDFDIFGILVSDWSEGWQLPYRLLSLLKNISGRHADCS
jgi:hypothetical protein